MTRKFNYDDYEEDIRHKKAIINVVILATITICIVIKIICMLVLP